MKWYVIKTKPKQENYAMQNLVDQGFSCFLPLYKRKKKEQWIITALFPSYLFIHLDLSDMQWRSINGTRGVKRIMCMDSEKPSPVPDSLMEYFMENEYVEDLDRIFSAGDKLQITDGPFKGWVGECELSSHKRVTVLLRMLGGQQRVQVDAKKVVMAS